MIWVLAAITVWCTFLLFVELIVRIMDKITENKNKKEENRVL